MSPPTLVSQTPWLTTSRSWVTQPNATLRDERPRILRLFAAACAVIMSWVVCKMALAPGSNTIPCNSESISLIDFLMILKNIKDESKIVHVSFLLCSLSLFVIPLINSGKCYFWKEGEIGVLSVFVLFLMRVGVYVGVCACVCVLVVYARTHAHCTWVTQMWAQGFRTRHLEGLKNPDGLNLSIYVFVYVYKVHMILGRTQCFFFYRIFLLPKKINNHPLSVFNKNSTLKRC